LKTAQREFGALRNQGRSARFSGKSSVSHWRANRGACSACLWERWNYSDRPDYLSIADIKEILRRHNKEKKKLKCGQLSMTTLGELWDASSMLVELLNSRYGHLGSNEREKLEIRWYFLAKAGYTPGAS
jgi:hypothetical protein